MKKLTILRGLPGSGKSTWVESNARDAVVCSADAFFYDAEGVYQFDPAKLGEAHTSCTRALFANMASGAPHVLLDNTCTRRWEYSLAEDMAHQFGYTVEVVTIWTGELTDQELADRNTHGVPVEIIEAMRAAWEHDWRGISVGPPPRT
jgi:predicted kinase